MQLKINLPILFILLSFGFHSLGQREYSLSAYVDSTTKENLVGYKNEQGDILIPAKFKDKLFGDSLMRIMLTIQPEKGSQASSERMEISAPFIYCGDTDKSIGDLKRFVDNGKIGYQNSSGKEIIKAKYDFIGPFENGFAYYCIGGESIYFRGKWFWDGNLYTSGFINSQGKEYNEKIETFFEDGNRKSVSYRLTPEKHSCQMERESFSFYQSGNLKSYLSYGTHPNCRELYSTKLRYNQKGDTVWMKKVIDGKIEGEFNLGHYDYFGDSTGKTVYDWFPIRTIWNKGVLEDFLNTNVIYLDRNYNQVNEKKMIKLINSKKVDWTYTYIAREVFDNSGNQITFIIHDNNKPYNGKDDDKLDKQEDKLSKHWVSRQFNRLIYHSDSISISFVDSTQLKKEHDINKTTILSKSDSKHLVKLFYNHGKYEESLASIPTSYIRLTSFNENLQPTILCFSEETGDFYVQRSTRSYVKMKHVEKLTKAVNKLVRKYHLKEK